MKRRILLIRTLTASASAAVFTTAGWLMGTRTLTMGGSGQPPTPCDGASVSQALYKCLNANCEASSPGRCGKDCWQFTCPDGGIYWICNIGSIQTCCEDWECAAL